MSFSKTSLSSDSYVKEFAGQLNCYKELIDQRINEYIPLVETQIAEQFGKYPLEAYKPFSSYMTRGGKRIRGALTILGYEMFGGKDLKMITDAAMAIEMLQSYLLIMDDIQDRSETRRGGQSAHVILREYHKKNYLRGDSKHFGESIAMDSFLVGCHGALEIISRLPVKPSILVRAIQNVHKCYVTTAHGQTLDIFNEVVDRVSENDVQNVLLWKTAYYTFVNPLQFGAILAGAKESQLDMLLDYAVPAGKAFQITDDILGVFGDEFESGKSPLDDIRDGKRTILITKALEATDHSESYFLRQCLGKNNLSMDDFLECKEIILRSGAKQYAENLAIKYIDKATLAMDSLGPFCSSANIEFLKGLVRYLIIRKS